MFAVFNLQMAGYSSGSSKQHYSSKASALGKLKEAKQTLTQNGEAIRKLEERIQRVEMKHTRSSKSINGERHSHTPSSRGSSNNHGREEEHRSRRHHHHSHEESYNRDQRYHQVFNIACKKVPSFNGDSDPNVYLDWEAKVYHYFHV